VEELLSYAAVNASVTHDTPEGYVSSAAVALLSHHLFYRSASVEEAVAFARPYLEWIDLLNADHISKYALVDDPANERGVPCHGIYTVTGVLAALRDSTNASDVLRRSVLMGGDTDSTASIALGLYAINHPLDDLPPAIWDGLANGPYGREYVMEAGRKLGRAWKDG
jgi:ADP-ribosylglycohydrolase